MEDSLYPKERFKAAKRIYDLTKDPRPDWTPCAEGLPTTGEIVRALGNPETLDQESLYYWSKVAAACIESQERELYEKAEQLTALTARAESAEAERDAAIEVIEKSVEWQKVLLEQTKELKEMLRGLQPQDGGAE